MKQFGKLLLVALGFGLLTVALSSMTSKPVAADKVDSVTVVNTPLPVSGTVNVGTLPPITGSVGITGTPNVNVANTLSVKEEGSPISAVLCVATGGGCGGSTNGYTVPSGNHLIIDYTSGRCVLQSGGSGTATAYDPELNYTQGGTLFSHSVAPSLIQQTTSSFLVFSWAQSTRIYADPATTVYLTMGVGVTGSGSAGCSETISGRLVSP